MRTYALDSGIRGTCADEDARIAGLEAENTELRKQNEILTTTRRLEEEARKQAEAALAERDTELHEVLHVIYEEGWPETENEYPWPRNDPEHLEPPEYERAMTPEEFFADIRARATAPGPKHICYLCHQPIQPDQESEEWEPGYRHFECPARAEEGRDDD